MESPRLAMISGGPSALGTSLEDGVAWRFWKFIIGLLVAGAAGSAAAQDYTAGKTPAQLFQSDCSACHKTPQGLSRGMDQRSLAGFLREHYTTKQESAGALAAYVAGLGGGGQRPPAGAAGQNPRPTVGITESEPGQKPGQRPRANAVVAPEPKPATPESPKPRPRVVTAPAAEPAQAPDDEGETSIMREDSSRRARTPAAPRDGAKPAAVSVDPTAAKLKSYGAAGGSAKETERLAEPVKKGESKVESYAGSGSPAPVATPEARKDAAAPADSGVTNSVTVPATNPVTAPAADAVSVPAADAATVPPADAAAAPAADAANPAPPADAATPAPKRKKSDRKKDAAGTPGSAAETAAPAATTAHPPRLPRRASGPVIQPPPGNN
jgi:hypothetical protein